MNLFWLNLKFKDISWHKLQFWKKKVKKKAGRKAGHSKSCDTPNVAVWTQKGTQSEA